MMHMNAYMYIIPSSKKEKYVHVPIKTVDTTRRLWPKRRSAAASGWVHVYSNRPNPNLAITCIARQSSWTEWAQNFTTVQKTRRVGVSLRAEQLGSSIGEHVFPFLSFEASSRWKEVPCTHSSLPGRHAHAHAGIAQCLGHGREVHTILASCARGWNTWRVHAHAHACSTTEILDVARCLRNSVWNPICSCLSHESLLNLAICY